MAKKQIVVMVSTGVGTEFLASPVREMSETQVAEEEEYHAQSLEGKSITFTTHAGNHVTLKTGRIIWFSIVDVGEELPAPPERVHHADGKFDVDTHEGFTPLADDEPVFVFRAKDVFMPQILGRYASLCVEGGASPEHIEAIENHKAAAIAWQEKNGCRVPD